MSSKQFTGGASVSKDHIHIHMCVGGQTQARAYNTINQSVDKLTIVAEALSKISLESTSDAIFYLDQLVTLFAPTNISILPCTGSYQITHNIHTLKVYLGACLEPFSINEAMQILNCTRIVRELESDLTRAAQPMCALELNGHLELTSKESICDTTDERIVQSVQQLREIFMKYIRAINTHRKEIDAACNSLVGQIDQTLAQ